MDTDATPHPYPHVEPVLRSVTQVLKGMSKTRSPQFCTLKARLGSKMLPDDTGRRRFVSGVEEAVMANLLCRLETSDVWSSVTPWTQSVDRTYLLQTGLQVLTTCDTPVNKDGTPTYVVNHVMQSDVSHVDLQWANVNPACMLCRSDDTACAVRVSVTHDEPVFDEEIQERVDEMTRVDVRQRRCFLYTPSSESRAVWSIDVSLIWRSTTYLDALHSMCNRGVPLYTIELRCLQPLEYLARLENNYAKLALSFVLKVADLFDAGTTLGLAKSGCRLVTDRAIVKSAPTTTPTTTPTPTPTTVS